MKQSAYTIIGVLLTCASLQSGAAITRRPPEPEPEPPAEAQTQTQETEQNGVLRRPEALAEEVLELRDAGSEHEIHNKDYRIDPLARRVEFNREVFKSDPSYDDLEYDYEAQLAVYGGKRAVETPRPVIEWGYPQYSEGALGSTHSFFGEKNLGRNQVLAYGDLRTAVAYTDVGGQSNAAVVSRLNLDIDWKLTSTERLHLFVRPLDDGAQFSRHQFVGDDTGTDVVDNFDIETLFFEGDVGAILGGFRNEYSKFDLPFAVGRIPLFLQNGIWVEEAFDGFAVSTVAKNSPKLDITNFDVTFFAAFNDVDTRAIVKDNGQRDDKAANLYALTTFMDVQRGYLEAGWGYIDDRRKSDGDQSYHNVMIGFTKRYFGHISNSIRLVGNFGQDPGAGFSQTADGYALLIENSLITSKPSTLIPYFNFFYGSDTPVPLARIEGLLKNTGINFEGDAMGGPTALDDSANNTFGGAIGIEYLFSLNRQIVVEVATVQTQSDKRTRVAGDQYAVQVRFQEPLTPAWIFRADAFHAWNDNAPDGSGIRFELRRKF
jgi:hypothetical protein